jgi:hypothetical protein
MNINGNAVFKAATYMFGNVFLTVGLGIEFYSPLMSKHTVYSTMLTSTSPQNKIKLKPKSEF